MMLARSICDMGCSAILFFHIIFPEEKIKKLRIARKDDATRARHTRAFFFFFQHPTCFRDTQPPFFPTTRFPLTITIYLSAGPLLLLHVCSDYCISMVGLAFFNMGNHITYGHASHWNYHRALYLNSRNFSNINTFTLALLYLILGLFPCCFLVL